MALNPAGRSAINVRLLSRFPSRIVGATGIDVVTAGGIATAHLDVPGLTENNSTTPGDRVLLSYDPASEEHERIRFDAMADFLGAIPVADAEASAALAAAWASQPAGQDVAGAAPGSRSSLHYSVQSAASLTSFLGKYIGAAASDPTLDGAGNALSAGALYFQTGTAKLRIWDGAIWKPYDADAQAAVALTNADVVLTHADVVLTAASELAAQGYAAAANVIPANNALAGFVDSETLYGVAPATGSIATANRVHSNGVVTGKEGFVTSFTTYVMTLGDGTGVAKFGFPKPGNAAIDVIHTINITGVAGTGLQTLTAGVHFPVQTIKLPAGIFWALGCATGGTQFACSVVAAYYLSPTAVAPNSPLSTSTLSLNARIGISNANTVAAKTSALDTEAHRAYLATIDNPVIEKAYGRTSDVAGDQGAGQDSLVVSDGLGFPVEGLLTGVQYDGAVAGSMDFVLTDPAGIEFAFFNTTIVAADDQVATPPTPIKAPKGSLLFRRSGGGRIKSYNLNNQPSVYMNGNMAWSGATLSNTVSYPQMRPIIRSYANVKAINDISLRGSTLLGIEYFPGTSTPTNWTLTGAQWAVNDGLRASGGGGTILTLARYNKYSNAAFKTTETRFVLGDATSKFGILTDPQDPAAYAYGTVALIDATAGAGAATLSLLAFDGSVSSGGTSIAIPFTLSTATGQEYLLRLVKQRFKNIVTLIDCVTGQSVEVSGDRGGYVRQSAGVKTGRQWGKPSLVYFSGDVTFKEFHRITNVKQDPHFLWFDDSNGEGGTEIGDNYERCYLPALEIMRGKGDTISMARGAANAEEAELCFDTDLDPFSPTYAVWKMGTNPSTGANVTAQHAAWRVSTANFITRALARGAQPVLIIPMAYTSNSTRMLLMRADITSYYFGKYPYVDLMFPTSTALDGVALKPLYCVDSGLHLSLEGHELVKNLIAGQAPYLIN